MLIPSSTAPITVIQIDSFSPVFGNVDALDALLILAKLLLVDVVLGFDGSEGV